MMKWLMLFACWIAKATETQSEYVILLLFHCNNGYKNVPYCYIVRMYIFCLVKSFYNFHEQVSQFPILQRSVLLCCNFVFCCNMDFI
jgi:hypothetical protein